MYNCIFIMCYLLLRLGEEGQLRLPCLNNKQYTTQNIQYEHKNTRHRLHNVNVISVIFPPMPTTSYYVLLFSSQPNIQLEEMSGNAPIFE